MTASKREKIRGALLAALMVASVFAAAAPASAAVADGNRTTASSVAPGGTTTVTVTATMDGSGGAFTLNEAFSGEIADATIQSVTVDGSSASTVVENANSNAAVVTLSSTGSNANVEVTYEITAASSPGSIEISGNVSGDGDINLGTDTITVGSPTSGTALESVDRTADTEVGTGGTASVTVSATLNSSGGGFSMNEAFSGAIADASIDSVTVNGSSASTVIANANSNAAVVTLASVPGNANVEIDYTITAASSPGSISISGNVSSSGTADLGTDTINVVTATGPSAPAAGSYSPDSFAGDDTANASTAPSVTTEVTDLDFSGATGNVDNVTVDPAAGAGASGIEADDINSLEVIVQSSSGTTSSSQSYDGSAVDFNFGNVSDVTGVEVLADVSSNIEDGDAIDVGIELGVGGSLFTGPSGLYDTNNTQTAVVAARDAFISAEVRDLNGEPVTNGTVTYRNLDTGRIVADNVSLNVRGETRRIGPIAPGTYEAEVEAPGFETFSARVVVAAGETREIDVTLRPIDILDRIEVTPKSATAIADEESITYTVTTYDKDGDRLSGVTVDATDDDPDIVFTSSTTNTTDSNGQATFTVTSPVIATGQLTFTARNSSGGPDQSTTATATFIQSGEGAIDGQVLDSSTTSGLPNATVYAVLETRWNQNVRATEVDLSGLSVTDDDDRIFVRLVDEDSGEIIDNDEYDIRTLDESGTGVRKVEELNASNAAVGEGFALVDIDGDGEFNFSHARLENEDYYAQVSLDANETSDERLADDDPESFVNVTGIDASDEVTSIGSGSAAIFSPSVDLTAEETRRRVSLTGANLVDVTDADGDFKLTKLYTEYQLGRDYVVVAEKTGYSTDFADVFVQEDGSTFEDRVLRGFNLEPEDIEPAQVNITQVGLHPNDTAYDPSLIAEFANKSDEFAQEVPRNGSVIDVVEVETLTEDGDRINGTAEVAVEDFAAFDGRFLSVAIGGTVVSESPSVDQITVNTGGDGVARLLLLADSSASDLTTNKTAVLTNDRSATDNTTVRFVGQINFQGAAISGIVTDSDDDPVQDSVVWAQSFVFPTDASSTSTITRTDQTRFTIQPDGGVAAAEVDDDSDLFIVTRQRWDGTSWVDVNSDTVTRGALRNRTYAFPRSSFPGVSVNLTSDDGFKLFDVTELTPGTDPDASYTLDPLPAVPSDTGASSTDYNVRGIKLDAPDQGATRFGQASIQPGSTDDANIVLPINLTEADLLVQNLNAPSSVRVGQTINVSADIFNNGGSLGADQTVEFRVDLNNDGTLASDEVVATTNVSVGPAGTESVTFNVSSSALSAGTTYAHGVFTEDDSETATIDVVGEANFTVDSISSPANISQGDTLNVSADITNVGDITGTKPVSLEINGTNVSTGTGSVDIVFAIDTSGSMSDEISAVQSGLQNFTNTLQSQGIDVRYAVVTFADQVPYNVRQNYTSNVTQTQQTVNAITTGGFTERSFDTVNDSIDLFDERAGANEFFVVFTDEDSDQVSTSPTASDLASRLDSEDISLFSVTLPEPQLSTADLSIGRVANTSANGQFFNLAEGDFSAKFENQIAGAIANASAGQSLTLNASETGTVEFSISGSTTSNLAPGNYTVEVSTPDDAASASLQVQTGCTALSAFVESYDSNGDCAISVTELGQAGSDYATGTISVTELGQVGAAYAST